MKPKPVRKVCANSWGFIISSWLQAARPWAPTFSSVLIPWLLPSLYFTSTPAPKRNSAPFPWFGPKPLTLNVWVCIRHCLSSGPFSLLRNAYSLNLQMTHSSLKSPSAPAARISHWPPFPSSWIITIFFYVVALPFPIHSAYFSLLPNSWFSQMYTSPSAE